jgi:hypothetical protein
VCTFMGDVLLFHCFSVSFAGFASYCHIHFSIFILSLFFLSCSFHLRVGPHPPKGYNPSLREEHFICATGYVFCFVFVFLTCFLCFDMSVIYV